MEGGFSRLRLLSGVDLTVVLGFVFDRGGVVQGAVQSGGVEPVHPGQGGQFKRASRPADLAPSRTDSRSDWPLRLLVVSVELPAPAGVVCPECVLGIGGTGGPTPASVDSDEHLIRGSRIRRVRGSDGGRPTLR